MQHDRLLRLKEVSALVGLGASGIYQRIREGTFPRGVPVGSRTVRWPESSVQAWIQQRIEAAQQRAAA
jgi:prophage regulatory protein